MCSVLFCSVLSIITNSLGTGSIGQFALHSLCLTVNVIVDQCSKCRGVWLDGGELDLIRGQGSTALYDAAYAGLVLPARGARSVIVLFSDGEDTSSWLEAGEVHAAAARADIVLQAIGTTPAVPAV